MRNREIDRKMVGPGHYIVTGTARGHSASRVVERGDDGKWRIHGYEAEFETLRAACQTLSIDLPSDAARKA